MMRRVSSGACERLHDYIVLRRGILPVDAELPSEVPEKGSNTQARAKFTFAGRPLFVSLSSSVVKTSPLSFSFLRHELTD